MNHRIFLFLCCLVSVPHSLADDFNVAVAANFKETLGEIRQSFHKRSEVRFQISSGSSGILYAQILAGAPFDIFLSADDARAEKLLSEGIAKEINTYAVGKLALWTPNSGLPVDADFLKAYRGRLAIANPVTAPYGKAAIELLANLGLTGKISLVKGNNIAQAYQFVESANLEAGLIAYSLIKDKCLPKINCWVVPQSYYAPILQKAALISNTNKDAAEFFTYLQSTEAQHIMSKNGYGHEDEL